MNIHKNILKYGISPLVASIKGKNTFKYLQELEKSQWYTPEQLKKLQEERLRKLLKHAYNNVPYYHKIFKERKLFPEDVRTVEDLVKLPFLTKEIIRENFNDLLAANFEKYNPYLERTGGSTGKPLQFYKDENGWEYTHAASKRGRRWAGLDIGDKYVELWANPIDMSRSQGLNKKISNYLINFRSLNAFSMGKSELEQYVKIIKKFKPKVIGGYASAVYLLAKYVKDMDIRIQPYSVITTAEKLFEFQRELIEEEFNCKVFDAYAGRDHHIQSMECEKHEGYHIATEVGVMEFIREGEHVSPSEKGGIIITEFYNHSMPFIRYENEDIGVPSDEVCSCGRGLPLMKSIEGRISDMLVSECGTYISGHVLSYVFKPMNTIKQVQILQKTKEKLIIKIVKNEKYSQKSTDYILKEMYKYFGDINIELEFVDSIPPSKSGKHRFAISEVPMSLFNRKVNDR